MIRKSISVFNFYLEQIHSPQNKIRISPCLQISSQNRIRVSLRPQKIVRICVHGQWRTNMPSVRTPLISSHRVTQHNSLSRTTKTTYGTFQQGHLCLVNVKAKAP